MAKREPTDADGPLFKAAYQRADDIDKTESPQRRRGAWVRFLGAAATALAEGFLRESMVWGAVLFSILAAVFGVTSGYVEWAIPMVISGLAGVTLVFVSQARRWSFGRQWAVLLGVLIVQCVLIVALWQAH